MNTAAKLAKERKQYDFSTLLALAGTAQAHVNNICTHTACPYCAMLDLMQSEIIGTNNNGPHAYVQPIVTA